MRLSGEDVGAVVTASAVVHGAEPIEVSEGGVIFFHPNHIEVVYTSFASVWDVAVTVSAILSLSRHGDDREWCWGATPMRWRSGPGVIPGPNLEEAPEWVREFVQRNHPVAQVGLRCIR